MKCSRLQVWLTVAALAAGTLPAADIPGRSPANQVFQYVTTQSFTPPGHKTTTANAYLWIPPACPRVRGVLVLGQNVPEQWLVGHPAIRKIAGIQIKDGQWDRLKSPGVPILVAAGTGAEWSQQAFGIFARWREMAVDDLRQHRAKPTAVPAWPGSLLVEGGSAHFACTEPMGLLIAQYIRAATRARLAPGGGPVLRHVDLDTGLVAGLPVPGAAPVPPKRYPDCTAEERT